MRIKYIGIAIIVLLIILLILNKRDFDNLNQINKIGKFPKIERTYEEIFKNLDTTKLKASYTYFDNPNRFPLATYKFENKYNVAIYKLGDSAINIKNKQFTELFSLINISTDSSNTKNIIYSGSFKTQNIRFNNATKELKERYKLNIFYNGSLLFKPIIKENLILYSIQASNVFGKYESSNFIDFNITNLNYFQQFYVELIFYKNENNIYLILTFPINNIPLSKPTEILNSLF